MKNKKTILYITGALLIMAVIFAWLMSGVGSIKEPAANGPEVAPHELKNTSLHEEDNGKKVWELTLASLIYDKERDVNVLKGIKGKFYQADGSNIAIESETGEIDMKTKAIMLTGHPKGVFSNGGELVADKLTWLSHEQKIVAEGNVKITKDDIVATAQKATMETAIEHLKLEGEALVQKGVGQ
jgi:LPS export ABC transporter protein LptC